MNVAILVNYRIKSKKRWLYLKDSTIIASIQFITGYMFIRNKSMEILTSPPFLRTNLEKFASVHNQQCSQSLIVKMTPKFPFQKKHGLDNPLRRCPCL